MADNLTYTYQNNKSNHLKNVSDPSGDMVGMANYVARSDANYSSDTNGNMIDDPAKEGTLL